MKHFLLRHFHCVDNEVSVHGLEQFKFLQKKLPSLTINQIVSTDHPRVQNTAKIIGEFMGYNIKVISSDVESCREALECVPGTLLISQQPILAEIGSYISKRQLEPSMFVTGALLEFDIL